MSTSPTRTLGIGLVSVGWMGQLHSRAYTDMPSYFPELGVTPRLVVAADVAERGRDYAVDVLGYERAVADYHEVLNDPEVDVVSICAPNALHREIGVAAAKAGKPFWIEKPVGRSGLETLEVEAAADEASVKTAIGFNYRHAPAVEFARQLIRDGRIGRVTNLRGRFFGGFNSNPNDPLAWRFVRETSGSGVLGDLMGHLVDLVHYVVGPISQVTASTGTYITERPALPGTGKEGLQPVENEDYANMLVRFHDEALGAGALGVLEASRIAVGASSDYGFEIQGTEGVIRWTFQRMNELEVAIGGTGAFVGFQTIFANAEFPWFSRFQPNASAGTGMGYDDLKTIEAGLWVRELIGETPEEPTLPQLANIHDAVASSRVLDAAEESAESGRWVSLPIVAGSTAAFR